MSKSDAKQYRIRNRLHQIEGDASEKEILARIGKGKYQGDEEVAVLPSQRWQKLSSHPRFYDAFLKRLYQGDYSAPEGESPVSPSLLPETSFNRDKATRQAEAAGKTYQGHKESPEINDDFQKTRNIAEDGIKNFGATIHQSTIDELFSNPSAQFVDGADADEKRPATNLIEIPQAEPAPAPEMLAPLDIAQNIRVEQDSQRAVKVAAAGKRRRLLLVGVIVVLMMLLFQMGGKESKPVVKDSEAGTKNGLRANVKQLITDSATKEERVRGLVEEGDRLYENDTPLFYLGAQELFNEALTYDDTNAAILGRLAEATARLLPESVASDGLESEIKNVIKKGRNRDPQFSQFYRAESLAALYSGKNDEAKKLALSAMEADPSNTENALVLGEVLYEAGEMAGAKTSFEEVLRANAFNIRARHYLALVSFDQRDFQKAQTQALDTLKLNPLHAPSYYLLAKIDAESNRLKEAKQLYETGGKLAQFGTKQEVGRGYYRLGLIEELFGLKNESRRSFRLSNYYFPESKGLKGKLNGADLAPESLRKLATETEYAPSYFTDQAESLVRLSKLRESLVFLQAAYLLQPQDGNSLLRLGEITETLAGSYDDFRTVVSFYQRAIERDPTLTKAYLKLGLLETDQYNLDRGYKLLKQAEALSPNDAAVYLALGKHYYKANDYLTAIEQFTKAYKINPSDSEILYYAGLLRLLGRKEGEKEAINYFYRSYLLNPSNYDALAEWLKLKVQNYEKNFSIKFVRNLMEQEPQNANFFWALGEIYAANKEFRRAVNFYHSALDLDNRSSRIRLSLAKSLEAVGELDKAIAEYRLASLLDRRNSEGFYRAADLLFQLKNLKEAEEVLKYLTSVTPNYPGAHRYLSKIYQARKQKEPAIAAMQKEVANNPQNAKFRIELAELFMEYEKYDLAIAELTEVTNLPPVDKAPAFAYEKIRGFLLLARCYRAQGKVESAEGSIRLALQTDPEDPELHRELGYVYAALQRDREAVKAFEFYLNRSPAAKDADSIKTIMQQLKIDE